jgi:hypothetical protein
MLLFLLFLTSVMSLDNLYIMRHCEKNSRSDCCSIEGMKNIKFYDDVKINKIYTAGFSTKEKCLDNLSYTRNKHCQHSKRMIITSHLLNEKLNTSIDYSLCTGQEKLLLKKIFNETGNILLVWNQQGIKKIYKKLNQKLKKVEYNKIYQISTTKKINFYKKSIVKKKIFLFFVFLILILLNLFVIYKVFFERRRYYQIIV